MLKEFKNNEKGFTLVELIVVIAIMAVLATLLIPRIMGNVSEASKQRDITTAQTLASEITIHNAKALSDNDTTTTTIPSKLAADHVLTSEELAASELKLPTGTEFPSTNVVTVVIDEDGNASISLK